jgi:hypothetical protein
MKYDMFDLLNETEKAENEIVGIEHTDEDDNDVAEKPYNPDDIRITPKIFSVSDVCRWMSAKPPKITIKPAFQRNLVWNDKKKSLLIESLMLRIPIPSFYFYEDDEGHKFVIDGLQRLSTIFGYVNGEFALCDLQYLSDRCNGKVFKNLDSKYISRIEDTQLSINILDSETPELVKFDVFTRINTGGVPLNRQEMRNVLASSDTMDLLIRMSISEYFVKATHGAVKDIRMDAQELCLRFITFYRAYSLESKTPYKDKPIAKMLDECVGHLNSCNSQALKKYLDTFELAMEKSISAFGDMAFTKPGNRIVINKPLFTSWAVTLAFSNYSSELLYSNRDNLVERLLTKLDTDKNYFNAITTSTATKKNIDNQFQTAHEILEGIDNAKQA